VGGVPRFCLATKTIRFGHAQRRDRELVTHFRLEHRLRAGLADATAGSSPPLERRRGALVRRPSPWLRRLALWGVVGSEIASARRFRVFRRRESEVLDSLAAGAPLHLAAVGLPSRKQKLDGLCLS
jgi:hypothetical protein